MHARSARARFPCGGAQNDWLECSSNVHTVARFCMVDRQAISHVKAMRDPHARISSQRVFCIDSNPYFRDFVCWFLSDVGCEVAGAVTEDQARACGIACDARSDFPYGIYRYSSIPSPTLDSGDAYARAKLRALELRNSIHFIFEQLEHLPAQKPKSPLKELAKNAFTIALTEGHRGQIAHVFSTDENGRISQVQIKDPSFHNWLGVALAVRENGISDFPLVNKSFDLSYADHDL
jgi:hypothetical protein